MLQPPPSQHEDNCQEDNHQQEPLQDNNISYLQSPAVKAETFHPFQPDPFVQVTASLAEAIMLMTVELCQRDPPSLSSK